MVVGGRVVVLDLGLGMWVPREGGEVERANTWIGCAQESISRYDANSGGGTLHRNQGRSREGQE